MRHLVLICCLVIASPLVAAEPAKLEAKAPESFDREKAHCLMVRPAYMKSVTAPIFAYLPAHAAELAPFLVEFLEDPQPVVRWTAAEALYTIRAISVNGKNYFHTVDEQIRAKMGPALLKHLDDSDIRVATNAGRALMCIDRQRGVKAIPYVLKWLREGMISEGVAIEMFNSVAAEAIPAVIAALNEPVAVTRNRIAATLGAMNDPIKPLLVAIKHDSKWIRAGAAAALGSRVEESTLAAPALTAALNDAERAVRLEAACGLVSVSGVRAVAAVPVLISVLRDGDANEKLRAVEALHRIGQPAKEAVDALLKLLNDKRQPVRYQAALALVAIDVPAAAKGVPVLREALTPRMEYDTEAIEALGQIGPAASEAIADLEPLFCVVGGKRTRAPGGMVEVAAALAVARIDPDRADKIVDMLVEIAQWPRHHLDRLRALSALRKIGPAAKSAIPSLEDLLEQKGRFQRQVAVTAIYLGEAPRAVAWMHMQLAPGSNERHTTLVVLRMLGPAAKHFLPELLAWLQTTDDRFEQMDLARILAAIGPAAKEAVPGLRAILEKTKNKEVRDDVEKALQAIKIQ